jgi:heat shock protein HslJ/poly(3-hydroxybutyrate) depolymerase
MRAWLAAASVIAGVVNASAQKVETGFLNRSLQVDGVEYRYQVYVPREFRRSTSWPVILALHGAGECGNDGLIQTNVGLGTAIRRHADRFPAIVVFPQIRADGTPGWQRAGARAALAATDNAIKEFSGDKSRVYLTGLSAGGNGSWYLASHFPERFAAVVVVCGWITEFHGSTGISYPALAPADPDPFTAIARRVSRLPIWIFHGDADATVPVEESRRMATALKAIGANVQYTELPGVGHNAWDPAYDRADLLIWMLRQRRGTNPVERSPDASGSPAIKSGGGKTVSLENTYWKLIRLDDKAVIAKSPKEPHLLLDSKARRVSGSGGCNNLAGSYELNGDQLILRQAAGTMMACLEGMEAEKQFLEALKQVSRWKVTAGQLLLSDAAGKAVAAFEARRMK